MTKDQAPTWSKVRLAVITTLATMITGFLVNMYWPAVLNAFTVPARLEAVEAVIQSDDSKAALDRILDKLTGMEARMEGIENRVAHLSLPERVVDVSDQSGPSGDFCVMGEPCRIDIRARRTVAGLSCRLAGAPEVFFRDPTSGEEFVSFYPSEDPTQRPANLNLSFKTFQRVIHVPRNVPPQSQFCLRPTYTACRDQAGDVISEGTHTPEPQCFSMDLRPKGN